MERVELKVDGMNCSHCTGSVERALLEQAGVARVVVSLADGRAVVEGRGLDAQAMIVAVSGLGYEAAMA